MPVNAEQALCGGRGAMNGGRPVQCIGAVAIISVASMSSASDLNCENLPIRRAKNNNSSRITLVDTKRSTASVFPGSDSRKVFLIRRTAPRSTTRIACHDKPAENERTLRSHSRHRAFFQKRSPGPSCWFFFVSHCFLISKERACHGGGEMWQDLIHDFW